MTKRYIRQGVISASPHVLSPVNVDPAKRVLHATDDVGDKVTLHDGREAIVVLGGCGVCTLYEEGQCHLTACVPQLRPDGRSVAFQEVVQ